MLFQFKLKNNLRGVIMSNEEFQTLVLKKFDKLDKDITEIKTDIAKIDKRLTAIENRKTSF